MTTEKWVCRKCGASSDDEPEDGDCNPMNIGPQDHTWVPVPPAPQAIDLSARFLTAEADYLRATGWVPLAPSTPGGPVRWQLPGAGSARGGNPILQSAAITIQKTKDGLYP